MMKKIVPALVFGLVLALTGCAGDAGTGSEAEATTSASADVAADAPEVDRDPQGELPTITFDADGLPTMETVSIDPPQVITVKTLEAGAGATVGADDYVSVNYAGFLWSDGTKFDSSYDNGDPAGFSLSGVIDGWKYGLAGTKVGDQLLIVVPSDYGYGDTATDSIPAGSTLVFVVDVLGTTPISTDSLTSATPTNAELPAGLTITGELGAEPAISFADGSTAPAETQNIVLAEGAGAEVADTDTLLYHIVYGTWGGETSSSWSSGVQSIASGGGSETVGKKVGTRLLLVYPADESSETAAQVYIIDLVGTIPAS